MSRLIFPDAIKAFLICFVVIGHTIGLAYKNQMEDYWYNPMITFIYSFHMPLFIAVSGFFLGVSPHTNIEVQIKKKLQRLGIPILSIGIIYVLVLLAYDYHNADIVKLFYKGLTFYWFFDCLLVCSLICILSKIKGERNGLIIQIMIILILFVAYPILPSTFRKLQIVRLLPIFVISLYIGKYSNVIIPFYNKYKIIIFLLSALIWGICIAFWGVNLLKYSLFERIIVGIFSSLAVLCVFSYVYKFVPYKIAEKGGKNCMGIYIFHAPIFLNLPEIDNPLLIVLLTILLIIASSVTTDVVRKTSLKKYILGEI